MGGYGGGRPALKACLESGLSLDLDKLIRDGFIRPGSWSGTINWRVVATGERTASVGYRATMHVDTGTGVLRLRYAVTGADGERHDVDETIPLETTPQRFGGWRWYVCCPVTGRRCRKLYLLPGGRRFAARQAWNARYRSQQQAPHDRALDQAHKLRDRLGAPSAIGDLIPRPKGMRRRTYARHMDRIERYEAIVDARMVAIVARLHGDDSFDFDLR